MFRNGRTDLAKLAETGAWYLCLLKEDWGRDIMDPMNTFPLHTTLMGV